MWPERASEATARRRQDASGTRVNGDGNSRSLVASLCRDDNVKADGGPPSPRLRQAFRMTAPRQRTESKAASGTPALRQQFLERLPIMGFPSRRQMFRRAFRKAGMVE